MKISFGIMIILLVVSVIFCIHGIISVRAEFREVSKDPSASGIDYLGIGWFEAIGMSLLAFPGLILSIVNRIISKQRNLKSISLASMLLFTALIVIAFNVF